MESLLDEGYRLLDQGNQLAASKIFEQALAKDFDNGELIFALKCERWWQESLEKGSSFKDPFSSGEYLVSQWKSFRHYVSRLPRQWERTLLAFKHYVFRLAQNQYLLLTNDGECTDPEIALRLGRMNKSRGNYEAALQYLESAAKLRKDDPAILAELADTNELINEVRTSKALFREAFFMNPQAVDLELLESGTIEKLVQKVLETGKSGHEVAEWVAVYGELLGVFSVKRELKPVEAGKLKQVIYELESELSNDGSRRSVLLPRLINRYFWLADHYINAKEDKPRIDEILLKIKLLDATVYKLYIA